MFFSPLTFLFFLFFFFAVLFFFVVVQINVIALVFTKIGIPSEYVFSALLATLLGSFVNIPIKKIPQKVRTQRAIVGFFGFRYVVPAWTRQETVLAVNLGGAVIPVVLSTYLLFKTGLWGRGLLATALMAFLTFRLARPLKGVGIALPAFIPAVAAALFSLLIAYDYAPVVAYISGTVGTLIGADLFNLKKIGNLEAPVASIGGAGTFDGIFLNGVFAVLLSALLS